MIGRRVGVVAVAAAVAIAGGVGVGLSAQNGTEADADTNAEQISAQREEATLSSAEMPDALKAVISAFPYELPIGQQWPEPSLLYQGEETDRIYDGVADMNVALYWQCAWSDEVLSGAADGDSAAVSEGITQLEQWGTIPAVQQWVSAYDLEAWRRTEIVPALAGDFTNMKTAHGGCAGFGFE